ncbi:MAG: 30S ribosomal protein S4e [Nanoarchaeota archaeon]
MAKRHLFSLNAPANWPIDRKKYTWITRPLPGPHPLHRCLPLSLVIHKLLGYAKTMREIKLILNQGEILIDKKVRKDYKFPVGIMDAIEIKKTNEAFRLIINNKNKYQLIKINKDNTKLKPCKIINKTTLNKGLTQLNLYDGRNIIVEKDGYKTGDTIILDLETNKIISHLKLEKGSLVYITDGKYTGNLAKIDSIINAKNLQPAKIVFTLDDKKLQTLKDYAFVINKEFTE